MHIEHAEIKTRAQHSPRLLFEFRHDYNAMLDPPTVALEDFNVRARDVKPDGAAEIVLCKL